MWILELYQNEIPAEVFSCKICKIFRITFLSNNSGQLLTVLLTFRERVPRDSLSRNFIKFAIKLSPPSQTIVIRNGNDYAQTHNPYFNSNFITTTRIFFLHKKDINFGIKYHIMLTKLRSSHRRYYVKRDALKTRLHCQTFLSEHFMKCSFRGISWNMKYFSFSIKISLRNFLIVFTKKSKI